MYFLWPTQLLHTFSSFPYMHKLILIADRVVFPSECLIRTSFRSGNWKKLLWPSSLSAETAINFINSNQCHLKASWLNFKTGFQRKASNKLSKTKVDQLVPQFQNGNNSDKEKMRLFGPLFIVIINLIEVDMGGYKHHLIF